jgi:acyl-homoserine-lactone acylase
MNDTCLIRAAPARRPVLRRLLHCLLLLLLPALQSCTVIDQLQERVRRPAPQVVQVEEPPPPPPIMEAEDPRVELLWDSWGVPHIFADDAGALFYAHGWAQMHSHGDLLLRLYGQARGRAAEYWGERFVESDTWVRTNGVPARAEQWLAEQSPHARAYLDAFVAGANAYADQNPDAITDEWRAALPVTVTDVLAHQQRVLHFTFIANPAMAVGASRQWQAQAGSNAWAVGPSRSASGNALLLLNPHLPWSDLFTWYEVHLVTPDMNVYGATLVGMPMISLGFNEHLGWTHTVNTIDAADIYELTTIGDAYVFDGVMRDFETEQQQLLVRRPDGTLEERPLTIRRSVHGPVIDVREGRALALRVAGLDASQLLEQYWDMARSSNRAQFEGALGRLQLPLFTVMYADRFGDIMHVFNGTVPDRPHGDWAYWQGIVPGDTSGTLWTGTHQYFGLPRVLNPVAGWLQNANDPPWTTTIPFAIEPAFFPAYMAPQRPMSFRSLRSARMLSETPRMTLERMVELKNSTRMQAADHIVHDVIAAVRVAGDDNEREAADVLERWDRMADPESRGAVLFAHYYRMLQRHRWPGGSMFDVQWSPRAPLATPDGLSDPLAAVRILGEAADQVRARHGSIDVPWGEVYRLRRDGVDLPAPGGGGDLGIFRVLDFEPLRGDSTRFAAVGGDSFISAVEFSQPVRAHVLMVYGNASQPGSPHRTSQLELFAGKRMREALLTREAVMQHLLRRETF